MPSQSRLSIGAAFTAVLALALPAGAQDLVPLFDGGSLAGWTQQGAATWRAQDGQIVGSTTGPQGSGGWLVLQQDMQDVILDLAASCDGCQAGVMVRGRPSAGGLSGTYLSLLGPDAGTLYRASFDAQGRELQKTELAKAEVPTPSGFTDRDPVEPGWSDLNLILRGAGLEARVDYAVVEAGGGNNRRFTLPDSMSAGALALRIAGPTGTQVRFKDIRAADLLTRAALPPERTGAGWQTVQLNDLYYSEGIDAADFNRDGAIDIVAGPFYYLGPDFQIARELYRAAPSPMTGYTSGSMLDFAYDFNGDGWTDVLQMSFGRAFLYLNPRGENRHWDRHVQMEAPNPLNAETNTLADVDGDGQIEIVGLSQGRVGYWEVGWDDVTRPWTFVAISGRKNTWGPHGFGVGDLNADGRMDILQARGWFERPASAGDTLWTYHETPFGRGAGIHAYDVDGDGDNDVIGSGFAHGWGLSWYENRPGAGGVPAFTEHRIMGHVTELDTYGVGFSEPHAVELMDVDGDGLQDIVTGKRWWSHLDSGEEDVLSPPVLYWFRLTRGPGGARYTPDLIHNNSGVGAQLTVADLDGDGTPDLLTSARKGSFIFLNQR